MLTCPLCKKKAQSLERKCPTCQADLSLLVGYVGHLAAGLAHAERMTRAGQLDEAVWAYLTVLEVDPDNAVAREQVGRVVAAVRQFDESAPSRRWLGKLQQQTRRLRNGSDTGDRLIWPIVVVIALALGLVLGRQIGRSASHPAEGTRGRPAASNGCAEVGIPFVEPPCRG